ncbi:hypothetical protein CLIB1423_01S08042 [[Candida] railenensis]|uniref:Uncharacterized protein n=1 Tax=[Candida] railenensis TaxID=45579 RepID=A0A9P0QKY7_9ASCO|nr:hypothetical protein CLIB1423_01S08042 [[Candida] railenensis]
MYWFKFMVLHLQPATVSRSKSKNGCTMPVQFFQGLTAAELRYIKILNLDGYVKGVDLSALSSLNTVTISGSLREVCQTLKVQRFPSSLRKVVISLQFRRIRKKSGTELRLPMENKSLQIETLVIVSNKILMSSKVYPLFGKRERSMKDNIKIGDVLAEIYCYFQPTILELKLIEASLLFKNFRTKAYSTSLPILLVAESLPKLEISAWDANTYKTVFVFNNPMGGGLYLIVRNKGLWVYTEREKRNEWIERIKKRFEALHDKKS